MTRFPHKAAKYLSSVSFALRQFLLAPFLYEKNSRIGRLFYDLEVLQRDFRSPLAALDLNALFEGSAPQQVTLFGYPLSLLRCFHRHRLAIMTPQELTFLAALVRVLNPKTIFEFGTGYGGTTANLVLNAPSDVRLFTICRSLWQTGLEEVDLVLGREQIQIIEADSLTFDFAPFSARMELVIVDAGHQYENIRSDTENALRMLKPGGIIVWHNYASNFPDVVRYLEHLAARLHLRHLRGTSIVLYQDSPNISASL
ncbi:MAG: class I SAM-dependent methyltransferase [Oligoflexia bacterium]|nr:class I SAM-dependent methyltransferase [Oligoflexia bacterium]